MMSRFLLTKRGCSHCRDTVRVVNRLNLRLPIDRRITIMDLWEYEEFGLKSNPLIAKFSKEGFDSYPFFYVDGIIIDITPTPEQLKILLETYLKEDFVI